MVWSLLVVRFGERNGVSTRVVGPLRQRDVTALLINRWVLAGGTTISPLDGHIP